VIFGELCRRCEFEFRRRVRILKEVFKKEFTKRDKLERLIEENPVTHEQLMELSRRLNG
jgi:hypothetical protein